MKIDHRAATRGQARKVSNKLHKITANGPPQCEHRLRKMPLRRRLRRRRSRCSLRVEAWGNDELTNRPPGRQILWPLSECPLQTLDNILLVGFFPTPLWGFCFYCRPPLLHSLLHFLTLPHFLTSSLPHFLTSSLPHFLTPSLTPSHFIVGTPSLTPSHSIVGGSERA